MCINKRKIARVRDNSRTITREEEAQIVALLRGTEINQRKPYYSDIADLVEVMIDSGIRQLESLELLYRDVNFTDNLILIRATKGNHRRVPMTKRVAAILKRRQEIDLLKPFNLSTMQIAIAWSWLRTQMGLKDDRGFILYALRRTCASRLINAGVDHYVIKEILGQGHSSRKVMEIYAQLALHQSAHDVEMPDE